MTEIDRRDGGSPFDAIRRVDEHGENWDGRELMPMLGYDKWERFAETIERARISIQNAGADPDVHASRRREASGKTERANYRLTRYGAYIAAMAGDVRKPEIARAQTYFAVKTREAEVAQPAPVAIPTARELAQLVIAAEDRADAEAAKRAVAEQRIAELEPKVEAHDAMADAEGTLSLGAVANMFGIGRQKFFNLLREEEILQADRRPYQDYADWFRVTTDFYRTSDERKHGFYVTRAYIKGALRLHALLGKRGHHFRKPQIDPQLRLLEGGAS